VRSARKKNLSSLIIPKVLGSPKERPDPHINDTKGHQDIFCSVYPGAMKNG